MISNQFSVDTKVWIQNGKIQITMEVPRWLLDELEYKPLVHSGGSFPAGGGKHSACSITFTSEEVKTT